MPKINTMRWALITGASSGIGEAFAYSLAKRGLNLILVGRDSKRLSNVGDEVHKISRSKVVLVTADLTKELDNVLRTAGGFDVDLLVNNAGIGLYGGFLEKSVEKFQEMIELNVKSLVTLTHHLARGMAERGHGGVINVSSVAAFFPIPNFAVYAATKAFVHSFSLALWVELKNRGVHVLCVAPGGTRTKFFERAEMIRTASSLMEPETVVEGAIEAFEKDKPLYIPGMGNRVAYHVVKRLLSDSTIAKFLRKFF